MQSGLPPVMTFQPTADLYSEVPLLDFRDQKC
jgi:hypothetical protein